MNGPWVVVDLADDLEAVAAVEVGRLKTVGTEGELAAAASACLVRHVDRCEQVPAAVDAGRGEAPPGDPATG